MAQDKEDGAAVSGRLIGVGEMLLDVHVVGRSCGSALLLNRHPRKLRISHNLIGSLSPSTLQQSY